MHKKLTITLDQPIYAGLHKIIGRGNISQFIEDLVRPYILNRKIRQGYKEMSQDKAREAEANEWIEGSIGDLDL